MPREPWTPAKLRNYVGDCGGLCHFTREGHRADEIPDNETGARFLKRLEEYFDEEFARVLARRAAP
jgi:hypothetical protein